MENKKHSSDTTKVNYEKLRERLFQINNSNYANNIKRLIEKLSADRKPTLLMATGGSMAVAHYLKEVLEHLGVICTIIEPRDYNYMKNKYQYSNLVAVSASGKSNGIKEALNDFRGNKYLISEGIVEDYDCYTWGNETYEKEKSFISLSTSLGPMLLILNSIESVDNDRVVSLMDQSERRVNSLDHSFKNDDIIQVMSGYDTMTPSVILESNLTETGCASIVVHEKGEFCHGRSNLSFNYPSSPVIYLQHNENELDDLLKSLMNQEYGSILQFDTLDLKESMFLREYYLSLQMFYLSRKIAEDKGIDITCPEYNPNVVKRVYKYRGQM